MQEVLLTLIFSFTIWYHLAYLTISTALLGFGLRDRDPAEPVGNSGWGSLSDAGPLLRLSCSRSFAIYSYTR
jgi:hypothetical protein